MPASLSSTCSKERSLFISRAACIGMMLSNVTSGRWNGRMGSFVVTKLLLEWSNQALKEGFNKYKFTH